MVFESVSLHQTPILVQTEVPNGIGPGFRLGLQAGYVGWYSTSDVLSGRGRVCSTFCKAGRGTVRHRVVLGYAYSQPSH